MELGDTDGCRDKSELNDEFTVANRVSDELPEG